MHVATIFRIRHRISARSMFALEAHSHSLAKGPVARRHKVTSLLQATVIRLEV